MKSLSLTKPLVLVIVGLPGSGKSFFARQFSETFGAPVVSSDKIRHPIFNSSVASRDEQTKVTQLANLFIDELLKTQKTFIVDGIGVTRAERSELRKTAQKAGYDTLLVWVQTDEATAKFRSMKRSSRRQDDMYNQSLSGETYDQLARRFTAPSGNESSVVISGKHTYATQARIVLKKLVAPRTEEVKRQPIVNHEGRKPTDTSEKNDTPPRRNVLIR